MNQGKVMIKAIPVIFLLTVSLFARFSATPIIECEAFNNMKHTKNSNSVVLDTSKKYIVLKKHKGQYLLLLKGQNPAQRWVDSECFSTQKDKIIQVDKVSKKQKYTPKYDTNISTNKNKLKQSILVLTWHNAFCEKKPYKKECKIDRYNDAGRLVLHGLWPQPRNNVYCNVPKKIVSKDKFKQWQSLPNIDIEPETLELMDEYMPGYLSYLHKHEWIKHGTCYGESADMYYHDSLMLAKQVDQSKVGNLFRLKIGKVVTIGKVREAFDKAYGKGAGKRVSMKCDGKLISELWINLSGKGNKLEGLIKGGKETRSRCRKGTVDAKN